jgi:hypothetical protein
MTATRDELGNVLCHHGRPFSCIECGEEYAQEIKRPAGGAGGEADASERDAGTPRSTGTLQAQRDLLRAALVGLIGVSTREELEQMEAYMRLASTPAADKAASIDAIHALLATIEG